MRLRLTILAMAAAVLSAALPWAAHAQPIQGIYINIGAGFRVPFDTKTTPLTPGFGTAFDLNQKLGFDTAVSLGYAPGNGWRFEVEGNLARNKVKGVTHTLFASTTDGTIRHAGVMANALFDLDVGSPWVFPYLGVGAGYQWTRLNGVSVTRTDKPFTFSADGQSGGFAMQAIMGLSFPVPNLPGLSITLDYRFMDVLGGQKFSGVSSFGPPPAPPPAQGSIKLHNQFSQSGILSVRYAFNTPPPAVMTEAAPASPPAVNAFTAAFEPGQATLTGRSRAMLTQAARDGQTARIEVSGEPAQDGMTRDAALAERRARAVTSALTGAGVPRTAIGVRGADNIWSHPARRMEIVIR